MRVRTLMVAVCLLGSVALPSLAEAQTAPPASATLPSSWGMQEIAGRVRQLDPRLRVTAAEQVIAHVAERRARWNRVRGGIGLHAGYGVTSTGWLPTETMERRTRDHATAAATAEIRLPLYAGGRLSAGLEAAEAQLRMARHDHAAMQLHLTTAAWIVYAEALAAGDQVRVSEHALSRARDLLDMARKKREAGIDTEADVARAELNLVRYEEDVVVQQGALRTALAGLRSALLLDDRQPLRLRGSLSDLAQHRASPALTHPDVARSRAAVDQARAHLREAESGYLPSVELFALGQYGNSLPGDPAAPLHDERFGPLSGSWATGVQAGWTVFDFFATRDQVATSEALLAARRADHDTTSFLLAQRRNDARHRKAAATDRLEVLGAGRQTAQRALTLARARYQTGNATLTEVLTAELEAIRLDSNRVTASLDLALAHIDGMQAEGSLP